jgi:hypothetical protein
MAMGHILFDDARRDRSLYQYTGAVVDIAEVRWESTATLELHARSPANLLAVGDTAKKIAPVSLRSRR